MKARDRIKSVMLLESDDIKDEYFKCECGNPEHMMHISFEPDVFNDEKVEERFPELIFNIQLSNYLGFWKRLVAAFKYVFKLKSDTFHWDCCSIREEDLYKFERMTVMYKRALEDIEDARRNTKAVKKKCSICGEGDITALRKEAIHSNELGEKFLVPLLMHACSGCNSEFATVEDTEYNKRAIETARKIYGK